MEVDAPREVRLYDNTIADANDKDEMLGLAELFSRNRPGVNDDAPTAVQLNEKSIADANDGNAMVKLEILLKHGAPGVDIVTVRAL